MMDFMWGYVMGQKSAAQAASFARSAGASQAMTSHMRMIDVDERIDRLTLLVEAMWSLLREQGLTDEDLAARLMELDQSDGTLDGRRTPAPSTCRSCGSKVAAGLTACQFCGTAVLSDTPPNPFADT